jgi:hypothetical protein
MSLLPQQNRFNNGPVTPPFLLRGFTSLDTLSLMGVNFLNGRGVPILQLLNLLSGVNRSSPRIDFVGEPGLESADQ